MQRHLGSALGELRYEPFAPRVRARVGDHVVVDTTSAVLVWEPRRIVPSYAVPVGDLDAEVVPVDPQPEPPDPASLPPVLGPDDIEPHTTPGRLADLVTPGRTLPRSAWLLDDEDLAGLAVLDFPSFDRWHAEEEELFGHARDPFKRIDVMTTSRHVRVELDGTVLADTQRAQVLLESPLPVSRYYIPEADVRTELLVPSETRTTCAYKGHAAYFSTADGRREGRDICWVYRHPLDDALRVKDHVCFWAERTDHVIDGEPTRRPITPWSPREVFEKHMAEHGTLGFV
ncbi:MAG: DUF427 domain-containing protein [Marmoricola sp.]|nr:DUF427 domain-containing protein [Marmoricola sp.]